VEKNESEETLGMRRSETLTRRRSDNTSRRRSVNLGRRKGDPRDLPVIKSMISLNYFINLLVL